MKRRNSSASASASSVWGKVQWNGKNFVFLLLLMFCFTTFFLLQSPYNRLETSRSSPSSSSSSSSTSPSVHHNPKIAFLFIARNRMPLDLVWDAFLKGDKEGKFSIYVHSRPGFVFNEATAMSPFFYGRQINQSIQVDWGGSSMIEAELILLKSALMDSFNKRFVFVSDSCIPLYNFSYTYDYIMSSPNSFVDSFSDAKDSRYNPKMHPSVPVRNWRKGSQWVVLIRKHAEVMVNDDTVFPAFQRHCKRKSLPEFWRDHPFPADAWKEHNCIPDEHYVQTLLAHNELEWEITARSLTHSTWDLSSKNPERRGWHPMTYKFSDATTNLIKSIKSTDNIHFPTENRREWCSSKEKPSKCFLFARKFTRTAGLRLLKIGYSGHYILVPKSSSNRPSNDLFPSSNTSFYKLNQKNADGKNSLEQLDFGFLK